MRLTSATIRLAAVSLLAPLAIAGAQTARAEANATSTALRSFEPGDFARFAPQTALQMLQQTPGFSINEGESRRGLGQAGGNVLINGRRLSSKSTSLSDALSRISVQQVVRLEILDGATLGIPGLTGQVANVVTRTGGVSGRWNWSPTFRTDREPSLLNGNASASGTQSGVDYTLALGSYESTNGESGPETVTDASGALLETRQEDRQSLRQEPRATLTLAHEGDTGNILNINLTGGRRHFGGREISFRSGPGEPDELNVYRDGGDGWNAELGADYEFKMGPGRLKLIGLDRIDRNDRGSESVLHVSDGSDPTGSRYNANRGSGESILRGEYSWLGGGDQDWQVALEGAFNYLEVASLLESLDSTGAFVVDPLAIGSSRVEERRAEANITNGRPLIGALSLQASAGVEYSELTQSGPAGQSREYVRPKGFVALSWSDPDSLDLSLRVERRVDQLDFGDFIDSVSLIDGNSESGNPEIVPPQRWTGEFKANRDLGDYGAVNLRVFADRIEDQTSQVPLGPDSEGPGNLSTPTTIYGLQLSGTLNLDALGLAGAKVDWSTHLADSSMQDPLTGEDRQTNGRELSGFWVGFRHDVPETDWAWGFNYGQSHHADRYRLDERTSSFERPGGAKIYFIDKDLFGMTAQVTFRNVLDTGDHYQRIVYVDRRDGPISYVEDRVRHSGPEMGLSISNSF
ncbi:MAG: TonB-dependent receptor plug domain-containing protein [Alphaproteobacteria bacterium]|nr:TonB-dependent receptor plug domain-containing protein [Alphaproteobacteria bacterium]